ncbi:MAG: adenylate/guanylate cyclase domain-containing protein [Rhizobiaceae bacterium]
MASFLTRNLPALAIFSLLVIIGALLAWHVWRVQKDFVAHQHAIMQQSVEGAASEVKLLIDRLRTSILMVADKNKHWLLKLAANPADEQARNLVQQDLLKYLPGLYAFTLADRKGDLLFEDVSGRVMEVCRHDIKQFVAQGHQQQIYVHPGPEEHPFMPDHHFDVMLPWDYGDNERGVFFVSFEPRLLSSLLHNSQVKGHRLFLVRNDQSNLIEIGSLGSREADEREIWLSPNEMQRVIYSQAVEDTRWNLVDLPTQALFTSHLKNNVQNSLIVFAGLILLGSVSLFLIKREERRRAEAEAKLVESLQSWGDTLEKRVQEQLEQMSRLERLKRFLSPDMAELIVSSGDDSRLQSHRSKIAIIFCDLRGFTNFSDSVEPEETMNVLNEYHAAMGELIVSHNGNINHRAADGIMVIFNDPLPCDDPPARALRLSITMRDRMAEIEQHWRKRGYHLGFGVGLANGYATLGLVGHKDSYDYTAIGRIVNLASRLCDEAKTGQILITEQLYADVEHLVHTEPVGSVSLRGFNQPFEVVNVTGLKDIEALPIVDTEQPVSNV